jgi:hypothetical protein
VDARSKKLHKDDAHLLNRISDNQDGVEKKSRKERKKNVLEQAAQPSLAMQWREGERAEFAIT